MKEKGHKRTKKLKSTHAKRITRPHLINTPFFAAFLVISFLLKTKIKKEGMPKRQSFL